MTRATATAVPDAVLGVLRDGTADGHTFRLPDRQLDRPLYVAVNDVLTRIGGRWDRSRKGHVFPTDVDPAPLVDLVVRSGQMPPRNPTAYYPTPRSVSEILLTSPRLPRVPRGSVVLEPSAGTGELAAAVTLWCDPARVDCVEVVPRFAYLASQVGHTVIVADFLAYDPGPVYDAVVTNPPFAVEGDPLAYVTHITHAWACLRPGGVLLAVAPAGFGFRDDRRVRELRALLDPVVFTIDGAAFSEVDSGVRVVLVGATKPEGTDR